MALSAPAASRAVVLGSEAVSALARKQKGMAERLEAALRNDQRVVIPSVVLAEIMTGAASDAAICNVVRRIPVVSSNARTAARAGALREGSEATRRKKRDLTVDAIVASVAVEIGPAIVVTADLADFTTLLEGLGVRVSTL